MSNHFEIFPTAIGNYSYSENDSLKPIIQNIMDTTNEVRVIKDAKHYFEYTGNFLKNPDLADFKKFLVDSINDYANNLLKLDTEFFISIAWINQTHKTCVMSKHNHGNAYFCGTYYLNYNEEIHQPVFFSKELEMTSVNPYMNIYPREYNNLNAPVFRVTDLKEGTLLLWPSNIVHGHEPNMGDNRISISMNFLPKKLHNGIYSFKISGFEDE
jgi:uncharacterized protein (TIGR02466 family)